MSRAFVKEDIDVPERTGARRSTAGLPAGAVNYITAEGADALRQRLEELRNTGADPEEVQRLEAGLAAAVTVAPPARTDTVVFGSTVTLLADGGAAKTFRIVGTDEVHLAPQNVSWMSPLGKALLGSVVRQRLNLPPPDDATQWQVAAIS